MAGPSRTAQNNSGKSPKDLGKAKKEPPEYTPIETDDEDYDEIESPLTDALKKAGLPSPVIFEETFFSRPADKINIPEVKEAAAKFVYNYYTRDERVRPDSVIMQNRIVSVDVSETDEIFYRLKNKKIARFVRIEFKPPAVNSSLIDIDLKNPGVDLSNNLDKIVVEGGMSNSVFIGTEILDTGKESKIYSMLNGILFLSDIPHTEDSPKGSAEKLYNTLSEKGSLKGQDKKLVINALANIGSSGYTLAPTDVPPEISNFASDPIGKQTFSVQFNQLLMSDVIANSTIIPDSVYQDELRSLNNFARSIKQTVIDSIPEDNVYQEADYDLQVDAVDEVAFNPDNNMNVSAKEYAKQFPKIRFAGYLVEKYEVLPDETVKFLGRLYLANHKTRFALDDEVRYGGSYFYKIRTVCQVKTIVSSEHQIDPSLNQLLIATVYMASEGVLANVTCVETVPPPAVQVMRATFDFESLLPRLTWEFPLNKQRDIKRFQIYKRMSTDEPFMLLKEYDFDNSLIRGAVNEIAPPKNVIRLKRPRLSFIDNTHNEGEMPIYSIACVDAHGMSSNLGLQVQVSRDKYTNKVSRRVISKPEAPKPYPNLFLNVDAFQDCMKVSGYDRIQLFLDPEYYRVFQNKQRTGFRQFGGPPIEYQFSEEVDTNFLAIDRENFRYSLHMINTDCQKDALVKIKIAQKTSLAAVDEDYYNVNVAEFSENNINFQYGVE